jgi:CubicO group peptidase (beta-lactamase class C family)
MKRPISTNNLDRYSLSPYLYLRIGYASMNIRAIYYLHSLLLLCFLLVSGCKKEDDPEPQFDSFEEEFAYLADTYVRMGASVGIIDQDQNLHEYYLGKLSNERNTPPDRHSIYEIGSITKTFTATLLAKMILDGKMELQNELDDFLPGDEVTVPDWSETRITLEHLVTHSSGLPRSPRNSGQPHPPDYDPYDPYAAYTTPYMYEYLSSYCDLLFEPGTQYAYSNTGMGLVGHVLGLVDSSSYEDLLRKEILESLGMNETSLFLSEDHISHLAPGHDENLDSAKNYFAQDIFQGAGFLKSSLNDMLIWLKVQMGLSETGMSDAIALTQQTHFDVGDVTYNDRQGRYLLSIGLAWHIDVLPEGYTFHWHGGRTNGYMAYMAFDREAETGVVILCNQSFEGAIIRFGEDVLKAVNSYNGN